MNNVFLIGNLVKDPEMRTTPNDVKVTTFTLAVQRGYKSSNGLVETDFIPVVTWRNIAENCNKFLNKGNKVAVSGSIQVRNYDDEDGKKRYVTEIVANNVEFLITNKGNNEPKFEEVEESLPF